MSREWKPGDVAMVRRQDGTETIALWGGWNWQCAGSSFSPLDQDAEPRRLLVIDPADREAIVQAIRTAAYDMSVGRSPGKPVHRTWDEIAENFVDLMTPKPPKPEEPTGLGAVVEDAQGHRWMRVCEHAVCNSWGLIDDDYAGKATGVKDGRREHYAEIAAVKVLSVGVQP